MTKPKQQQKRVSSTFLKGQPYMRLLFQSQLLCPLETRSQTDVILSWRQTEKSIKYKQNGKYLSSKKLHHCKQESYSINFLSRVTRPRTKFFLFLGGEQNLTQGEGGGDHF